jgi:hypothetical protein
MTETTDTPVECWRAIPDNEGYEASNFGRIRSLDQTTSDGRRIRGRVLKPWISARVYLYVSLGRDTKISVHRAVCLAFHGKPADGQQAAHLDGKPSNNAPTNLVWATSAENAQHKRLHGTNGGHRVFKQPHHKKRGTKPTRHPEADRIAALLSDGVPAAHIARMFGMSKSGMHGIIKCRM